MILGRNFFDVRKSVEIFIYWFVLFMITCMKVTVGSLWRLDVEGFGVEMVSEDFFSLV